MNVCLVKNNMFIGLYIIFMMIDMIYIIALVRIVVDYRRVSASNLIRIHVFTSAYNLKRDCCLN